ncbi:hypothetical protein A2631_03865 [Candidatus Daviesbacteria bacterium RIFCSPHIGHO2_01_FULL_44_29]|uniref:Peptidase S11 D-alanyl-D-alanine carboxypeptidase A N-terminal domain-containing protein n=1 Tax=Candidatus Daviesbacteria bacterium RIFCSPHIGHO2_02_FULL_43_12 TaxID=1797776 RepID=A0A1F5KG93_9BACT|nr:MAG: hypothetical protein A2631_03865 [Candidatus Daviesbacteria bacterium RIFCSPHIGHO2_01_FULL_44_29]OGE39865.1 MAG: hypothetical protein A3E86_01130 [Candidatus Daviesbacteria bacterium RIFCSPHIGHO2_12_FULL_47_45]OGE39869.1 MAG: hypothetical protein A3D25_03595 [Candidatus Daviesbacteria bacterium RIFCSPHIGHO2_02_FULL_43_12]OGE70450.1 MAG: hypothetical protein A3B55_01975 [Candidatus Daviesbacteria bacterium RIFCSPLOWO2_01_FULL_43_15]
MRKLLVALGLCSIALIAGLFVPQVQPNALVSPVFGQISIADNLWLPEVRASEESGPTLTARSAFFVDTQTAQVLFEKNSHLRLPIASLAKIMTVIVTLENKKFTDQVSISNRAAEMEPDKMLLIGGESLSVEELLDGVFLVSANDAAEALAEAVTGQRDDFIPLMNLKAKQLGMKDTLFINPTGLEEDGAEQFSSAYDVALMSRFAIQKWPHLVDISSREHILFDKTPTHQDYDLYSGINLLSTYPGVVGFKTGFTPEAGLTLVTLARKQGKEVLGVLLGSTNRRDDARTLLDYSFTKLSIQ